MIQKPIQADYKTLQEKKKKNTKKLCRQGMLKWPVNKY